jgi:hypothetical protein
MPEAKVLVDKDGKTKGEDREGHTRPTIVELPEQPRTQTRIGR